MNEIARTVLISAVSGLIAFAAAVLYLGGDDSEPSAPSLTRADVQAMIDDTTAALMLTDFFSTMIDDAMIDDTSSSLTRADVQAMISAAPSPSLTRADVQAMISAAPSPSLTRADVQAMISAAPSPSLTRADVQAMIDSRAGALIEGAVYFSSCMDAAILDFHRDLWHRDLGANDLNAAEAACFDEAAARAGLEMRMVAP